MSTGCTMVAMPPTLAASTLPGHLIALTEPVPYGYLDVGHPGTEQYERTLVETCTGTGPYVVRLVQGFGLRWPHPAGTPAVSRAAGAS
jgi:hypothetical protein